MEIITLTITVLPRGSQNQIISESDDHIKIKLTASPVKGKANQELIKFLAKKFKVAQSNIEIIKGLKARKKVVRIYKEETNT